jgi:hypothetical protein
MTPTQGLKLKHALAILMGHPNSRFFYKILEELPIIGIKYLHIQRTKDIKHCVGTKQRNVPETKKIKSYRLSLLYTVRTFPAVHFACLRGTFCKSQCNQWQEQVGKDLSGNQPDTLSGFIRLHWTARLIERAPVKSNTPSSRLPSSNAVSPLQLQVARPSQSTADQ